MPDDDLDLDLDLEHEHEHDPDLEAVERLVAGMLERIEPIPPRALQAAYQAREMRLLTAELATLLYDSERDGDLVLTRSGEGEVRLVSLANDHLSIELTLMPDGESLVGELSPVDADEVIVETGDGGSETVAVDEFGRFRASAAGPLRLRVPGRLITPWITR